MIFIVPSLISRSVFHELTEALCIKDSQENDSIFLHCINEIIYERISEEVVNGEHRNDGVWFVIACDVVCDFFNTRAGHIALYEVYKREVVVFRVLEYNRMLSLDDLLKGLHIGVDSHDLQNLGLLILLYVLSPSYAKVQHAPSF